MRTATVGLGVPRRSPPPDPREQDPLQEGGDTPCGAGVTGQAARRGLGGRDKLGGGSQFNRSVPQDVASARRLAATMFIDTVGYTVSTTRTKVV
jgi:hypothetical protein